MEASQQLHWTLNPGDLAGAKIVSATGLQDLRLEDAGLLSSPRRRSRIFLMLVITSVLAVLVSQVAAGLLYSHTEGWLVLVGVSLTFVVAGTALTLLGQLLHQPRVTLLDVDQRRLWFGVGWWRQWSAETAADIGQIELRYCRSITGQVHYEVRCAGLSEAQAMVYCTPGGDDAWECAKKLADSLQIPMQEVSFID